MPQKFLDFGWANGWGKTPKLIQNCQDAGHETSDVDIGPPNRGLEHVVKCEKCNYIYRYDCSD